MERPASKLILAAMFFAASAGLAMAQNYDYLSRSDFVSLSSGDSSRANIAIQTETPWPVYLNNVTIPGNSDHAISALEQLSNSFKAQTSSPSTVINVGTTGQ
jgi:hypothetical protein